MNKKVAKERTQMRSDLPFNDPIPWPDRAGYWWCRHHWGMELVESYEHGDTEETECAWAIKSHNGGIDKGGDGMLPRDLEFGGDAPEFVWLAPTAPFDSPNDPDEGRREKQSP